MLRYWSRLSSDWNMRDVDTSQEEPRDTRHSVYFKFSSGVSVFRFYGRYSVCLDLLNLQLFEAVSWPLGPCLGAVACFEVYCQVHAYLELVVWYVGYHAW